MVFCTSWDFSVWPCVLWLLPPTGQHHLFGPFVTNFENGHVLLLVVAVLCWVVFCLLTCVAESADGWHELTNVVGDPQQLLTNQERTLLFWRRGKLIEWCQPITQFLSLCFVQIGVRYLLFAHLLVQSYNSAPLPMDLCFSSMLLWARNKGEKKWCFIWLWFICFVQFVLVHLLLNFITPASLEKTNAWCRFSAGQELTRQWIGEPRTQEQWPAEGAFWVDWTGLEIGPLCHWVWRLWDVGQMRFVVFLSHL